MLGARCCFPVQRSPSHLFFVSAPRQVSPSALMPAGQGGRQGGGSGSSQGQPRGGSRKREPKGSSHAKPGAPTQKAYVATPADRKGTRSITEYFVRRGPLSPRSDGSVFTASEGGTSSRAPSRQGDAPQTSSTSTSTLNADQGDVLSAVVRAAGEAVHSAAQMLTGGLSHLLSHYGSVVTMRARTDRPQST